MPRFFVRKDQVCNDTVHITGEDAHHIARSLRMAVGETVEVCDMQKTVYTAKLSQITDTDVEATILSSHASDTESPYRVHLYQALPKADKMETIIQKTTETGVYSITPFFSQRCIVKIDKKDYEKRQERFQKIAESAAKQSGRGIIPSICPILSFSQMLEEISSQSTVIFCYEGEENRTLKQAFQTVKGTDIAIIIGAEGGFSVEEAEKIQSAGGVSVSLGKRILRCETAPSFVLSCLTYETEL